MKPRIPLLLIHGYSDVGESFLNWKNILVKKKVYEPNEIFICNYRTLTNEVTIKDIAEGFDRALRVNPQLSDDQEFDAIVHSTGMLVLRAWLTAYGAARHKRIKRLIGIAPATYGSPLAHKGRSWIGSIFKGNRKMGPDFMEAGDLVLDGLELGSRFTWDLAHRDILSESSFYGPDTSTPYVFTFCGDTDYSGIRGLVAKSPGTDGTVRWAGCSLNSRKITIDYTKSPDDITRTEITKWPADTRSNLEMALIPVRGLNHGTILEDPSEELVDLAIGALNVDSMESYKKWTRDALAATQDTFNAMDKWQQFIVRASDERNDPITDFNLQLYKLETGGNPDDADDWEVIPIDVHAYQADVSYRCFHVNLANVLGKDLQKLKMEFMASTGTELLGYLEHIPDGQEIPDISNGQPTFTMDITPLITDKEIKFFYPFTTTLIEVVLNREPLPLRKVPLVAKFLD